MDKEQVIYQFWSGFGLQAWDENSVPTGEDAPELPYITYGVATDSFGNAVSLSGSLWYLSNSWKDISRKSNEISNKIGLGGMILPCDHGAVWIKRGSPFAQRMGEPSDDRIRRIFLNLEVEFLVMD